MANPVGRPTSYSLNTLEQTKQYLTDCIDRFDDIAKSLDEHGHPTEFKRRLVVNLPSVAGLAVHLKCARSSIYEWAKQHPEFSDMLVLLARACCRMERTGGD